MELDPHFVLAIKPEDNQIVVGKRDELQVDSFKIKKVNLFKEDLTDFESTVKVRYRTRAIPCRVKLNDDAGEVELSESVFGLAYGQIAVFYEGDKVIGSGVIC